MAAVRSMDLSVCCMSSGTEPERLAAILALYAPVADEIVVAVEEPRALEAHAALDGRCGLSSSRFPPTRTERPSDPVALRLVQRPMDLQRGRRRGSVAAAGRDAARRRRPRRHHPRLGGSSLALPTTATHLDEAPWNTEFQLRLLLADAALHAVLGRVSPTRSSRTAPASISEGVLWHLDTAVNLALAAAIESRGDELERPGMRIGGRVAQPRPVRPELAPEPRRRAGRPCDEHAVVERVLGGRPAADPPRSPGGSRYASADRRRRRPGRGDARIARLAARPDLRCGACRTAMRARVQETVDVSIANESDVTWRWGKDARPPILLGYSWSRERRAGPRAARSPHRAPRRPRARRDPDRARARRPARRARPVRAPARARRRRASGRSRDRHRSRLAVDERERLALVGEPAEIMRLLAQLSARRTSSR